MKDIANRIKKALFVLIILFLILPFFQAQFKFIKVSRLKGAVNKPVMDTLTFKKWFSGEFQENEEKYLNETFGFRTVFIRINNQIAFTFFNKAKANGVIIGKKNYLYEYNYIKAYYGVDFIGDDSIKHKMLKLKFIQDTLVKLNKTLLIVFAAGKGSYYPEYIPEELKLQRGNTNYKFYIKYAEELKLNYIDFNKYFIENKYKSKYPLYPQYGIHWSYYGMCLAADSIIKYIEKIRDIDMPNMYWKDIELANPKMTDYDVAEGMNLKFKLKSFKMAYPKILFQPDSGKTKPSVLVVSDSFYWGMFNFGIFNAFSANHFWYYNREIYPDSYKTPIETSQLDLKEEISKHDVIIIMATDATLPNFGWGFIESLYTKFQEGRNIP